MSLYEINKQYFSQLMKIVCDTHEMYASKAQTHGLRIEFTNHDLNNAWHSDKAGSGMYRLVIGDTTTANHTVVSTWELWQMKNCCGICVSTAVQVKEEFRKKGLGTLLNKIRQHIAKLDGYGLLLCTDVLSNKPQQKVLAANGWTCVQEFKNPRTNNKIGIHTVDLSKITF